MSVEQQVLFGFVLMLVGGIVAGLMSLVWRGENERKASLVLVLVAVVLFFGGYMWVQEAGQQHICAKMTDVPKQDLIWFCH